jgi:Family of unknown function (DUF5677)
VPPTFPLPDEVAEHHNAVIWYCSNLQKAFADSGKTTQTASLSSLALANLLYIAIIAHRSIRTLCEEGWATVTPIIIRTMLDMGANCMAITHHARPDYMGFKYLLSFHIKLANEPSIPNEQRKIFQELVESYILRLNAEDQSNARELVKQRKGLTYWFQPEFKSTKKLLKLATVDVYSIYELFSGPAHGGWSSQAIFNDDSTIQDINPREHPSGSLAAIKASSRLLLEMAYTRDGWDHAGFVDEYKTLVQQNDSLPKITSKK